MIVCKEKMSLFERQTYMCELHKANVEVNKYLWRQYELKKGRISPHRYKKITNTSKRNRFLYIYANNQIPSICGYTNSNVQLQEMSNQTLSQAFEFCETNNYVPVFCGFKELPCDYYGHQIVLYSNYALNLEKIHKNCFPQFLIMDYEINENLIIPNEVNSIILICQKDKLSELSKKIDYVVHIKNSININIMFSDESTNISSQQFIIEYEIFLKALKQIVLNEWTHKNYININVLTNELFANTNRYCGAGESSLFLSPEGRFYICAVFYYKNQGGFIGDINEEINNIYSKVCDMDKSPLCHDCNIKHCARCVYKNKVKTGEYSIASEEQCIISYLEYKYSRDLIDELIEKNIVLPFEINKKLGKIEHPDPIKKIRGNLYLSQHLDLFVVD